MKILVVGAGVGGMAAGRGLLQQGHSVSVVERSAAPRREGAAVTLWPNGAAVLTALGVPLDGLGRRIDGMVGLTHRGRPLVRVDASAVARRFGTPTICVPRRELVQRLGEALPAGVVTFGAMCRSVVDHGGRVEATFADGSIRQADVVVGADGRGSLVRHQLWARPDTRPTGWVTWQGLSAVPIEVARSRRVLSLLGPEGLVGLQPAGGGLLQWFFSVPPTDGPPRVDRAATAASEEPLSMLRRRFAGYADPVPQLLESISGTDLVAWPHHSLPVPPAWGAGRVTLLGDAAHAMPPSLAQGVNQTLEDVHCLVRALHPGRSSTEDVAAALRRYEAARARQLSAITRMAGSEVTTTFKPLTQSLMRVTPRALSTARYRALLERSSSFLHDPAPAGAP